MLSIRRFEARDAAALSALIRRCFLELNIKDYSLEALQYWVSLYTPEHVAEMASKGHTYVCEEEGTLLGTCSIVPREEERNYYIEALYTLPDRTGEGIASRLLAACEQDPGYPDPKTLWVDSSISARTFYEAKGYLHETGEPVCIENDHYIMYKKTEA